MDRLIPDLLQPTSQQPPGRQKCGAVAEWSKALAWKVSIRQKRIEGSNPSRSATILVFPVLSRPPGLIYRGFLGFSPQPLRAAVR